MIEVDSNMKKIIDSLLKDRETDLSNELEEMRFRQEMLVQIEKQKTNNSRIESYVDYDQIFDLVQKIKEMI